VLRIGAENKLTGGTLSWIEFVLLGDPSKRNSMEHARV
jgi:hypothetical protein